MEEWRDVPGYEGAYQVSDLGRVRSLDRVTPDGRNLKGRVLKQQPGSNGYLKVELSQLGEVRTYYIHTGVAAAFIGPRPLGLQVCHNDEVGTHNQLRNLRYDTRSENAKDIVRSGRHHEARKTHCRHGHEFTEKNTRIDSRPDGRTYRRCRQCERDRKK